MNSNDCRVTQAEIPVERETEQYEQSEVCDRGDVTKVTQDACQGTSPECFCSVAVIWGW
jgi:hypothetical protein